MPTTPAQQLWIAVEVNVTEVQAAGAQALFCSILGIELLLIFTCFLTEHVLIQVLLSGYSFHTNFNAILLQPLIANYFFMASRLVLILNQQGFLPFNATYVRVFIISLVVLTHPILMLERIFATLFIADYERQRRRFLCFSLLAAVDIPSAVLPLLFIYRLYGYHVLLIGTSIACAFTLTANILAMRVNRRRWELHEKRRGLPTYSLSERFQLSENMRALKIVRPLIFLAVVSDMFCVVLLCLPFLIGVHGVYTSQLADAIFEMLAALYCPVVIGCTILVEPEWRRELFRRLRAMFHIKPSKTTDASSTRSRGSKRLNEEEGAVYFDQLRRSWETPPRPKTSGRRVSYLRS